MENDSDSSESLIASPASPSNYVPRAIPTPSSSATAIDSSVAAKSSTPKANNPNINTLNKFIVKTSKEEKEKYDEQCAKFIFATNSAFLLSDHPEFLKFCEMLRPGYRPPDRQAIGGKWLNIVNDKLQKMCVIDLKNQPVCMSFDGWSNIRHEPIVSGSITMDSGNSLIADSIDTSGQPHTALNLKAIAKTSIARTQEKFECVVRSIVTDDAANMVLMRKFLSEEAEDILSYGCAAHALNNLAHDYGKLENNLSVRNHVTNILKYFKSHHLPYAAFREAGGSGIVLPIDVRWNTTHNSLECYLKNWSVFASVSDKLRSQPNSSFDIDIANKVV